MRRVVVTGMGMVTPLACGVEATWQRLIAGASGASKIEKFDVSDLPAKIACQIPHGDGSNGTYDPDASFNAAQDMVNAWQIAFRPAWPDSRHFTGDAIDMTMWWNGDIIVNGMPVNGYPYTAGASKDQNGNELDTGDPQRTGNTAMHDVGRAFGVIKLPSDPPHWSIDGN